MSVTCTKQYNLLVNPVLAPPCPTIIGNTNHYTAQIPPLTTQQPTPYATADIMHVLIPVSKAVLHPVMGAAQTYSKLINNHATQNIWIQSNTNKVAHLMQGLKKIKYQSHKHNIFMPHSDFP